MSHHHLDSAENTSIGSIEEGAPGLPAVIVVLAKVIGVIPPKLLRKLVPANALIPPALIVVAVGNMDIVSAPHRCIPWPPPTPFATENASPKLGAALFWSPGLMLPG